MEIGLTALTGWEWLALGTVLIILEMVVGTSFFLLWLGLWSIILAGLVYVYPLSWATQWMLFAAASSITVLIVWARLKRQKPTKEALHLNQGALRYLHQEFNLDEAIVGGRGRLKIGDSVWPVIGPSLPAGTRVRVVGVEGINLRVKDITS